MRDTTTEARKVQLDIILSKTPAERAMMGVDMIDTVYNATLNAIAQDNSLSKGECIAQLFKRYYKNDLPDDLIKEVSQKIIEYHRKN